MKILFVAPHLSTGGMPQFLLKRIKALQGNEIYVVEYQCHSLDYVVQRNAIINIVGENFTTLYENKMVLFDAIDKFKPNIIHIDEMSERLDRDMVKKLYNINREYRIVETCHDVSFEPSSKIFHPDLYIFCTPYHEDTFADLRSKFVTIQYPIENKEPSYQEYNDSRVELGIDKQINVLNIGLWTPGKNQAEGIEIARGYPEMNFHFVGNQAGNFKDYWEPLMKDLPENVKVWGERNDVEKFLKAADIFMFNSTFECNPLSIREAISHKLPIVARNLPQYKDMFTEYIEPIDSDLEIIYPRYSIPEGQLKKFKLDHYNAYLKIHDYLPQSQDIEITQHFVDGPFLEIKGVSDSDFLVKFFDEKGKCYYANTIKSNSFVKLNRKYYTKWTAKVYENGKLIYDKTLNLNGKRVYIALDSKSLGDTIAWAGYALEFQKKHHCKVIMSTFWNHILDYPELELANPGTKVDCYAMYKLGWHWDENKEPVLCNTIPLQQSASNILGLDFEPIRPRLKSTYEILGNKIPKYITIATNSTMECKFWTREGWQEVIDYLHGKGYNVENVSKEDNPFKNCSKINNTDIRNTMDIIAGSELFIGLSSGLSWLSWALNKKVVMISNFTEQDHEFDCYRVIKPDVCNGCWNDPNIRLDPFWNWCPRNKNFECQRSITPQMVIDKIKEAGF